MCCVLCWTIALSAFCHLERRVWITLTTLKVKTSHRPKGQSFCFEVCLYAYMYVCVQYVYVGVWEYILTLVVFTLFPVLQLQPVRSGRTLHSSPSKHGCIWHHHFWATIDATHTSQETWTNTPRLVQTETLTSYKYRDHIMEWGKTN